MKTPFSPFVKVASILFIIAGAILLLHWLFNQPLDFRPHKPAAASLSKSTATPLASQPSDQVSSFPSDPAQSSAAAAIPLWTAPKVTWGQKLDPNTSSFIRVNTDGANSKGRTGPFDPKTLTALDRLKKGDRIT